MWTQSDAPSSFQSNFLETSKCWIDTLNGVPLDTVAFWSKHEYMQQH